jgi:hypothetical protein
MAVTDENRGRSIRGPGKEPFDDLRVGCNPRSAAKQPCQPGPHHGHGRIAEKGRREQNVPLVLYQEPGDTQVRNGNDLPWIAALPWRAPDSVRTRFDLLIDRNRRAAADQKQQRDYT